MRHERSLMSLLSLLVALVVASVVSPSALTACGSALGVVLMYGVILRMLRWRRANLFVAHSVAMLAVGAVAALVMAECLRRWSAAVGVSPLTAAVVWSGIIAFGLACDSLASWWRRHHASASFAKASA